MASHSLPADLARALTTCAARLQADLGPRLRALVLYGSAVAGEWAPRRSDINLLVVLEQALPRDLATVGAAALAPLAPVVVPANEIALAAACAPAVWWDLSERQLLLVGDDPTDGLTFDPQALRRQLTFEARDKLARLRAEYLVGHSRPQALGALLQAGFGSLLHLVRGALRLADGKPGRYGTAVFGEASRQLGLELRLLQSFQRWRLGEDSPDAKRLTQLCGGLLSAYEQVALWLERLPEPEPDAPVAAVAESVPATESDTEAPAEANPA